jgi:hypothetical protein
MSTKVGIHDLPSCGRPGPRFPACTGITVGIPARSRSVAPSGIRPLSRSPGVWQIIRSNCRARASARASALVTFLRCPWRRAGTSGQLLPGLPDQRVGAERRNSRNVPPARPAEAGGAVLKSASEAPWRSRRMRLLVASVRNPTICVRRTARNPAMPHAALPPAAPSDPAAVRPRPPAATKRGGNANLGLAPVQPARGAYALAPAAHAALPRSMANSVTPQVKPAHRLRTAGAVPARVHPRACHGRARGAASGCAAPAPSMAATAPTHADNRHRLTSLRIIRHARTLHWPSFVCRLRPRNCEPTAKPGSTMQFKPSRIDPLNREPTAKPGSTVPFKPSRIDPLNREPTAKPGSTVPFRPSRIDPLNREPTAKPGSTAPFEPSRIDPLNREPTAKPGSTAPRVAGSNASSAAATVLPIRAHDPAPPRGQSGEGTNVRAAP